MLRVDAPPTSAPWFGLALRLVHSEEAAGRKRQRGAGCTERARYATAPAAARRDPPSV